MSDFSVLPPLPASVTKMEADAANDFYPEEYIIEHILRLSSYLIDISDKTMLFGKSDCDPYSASLYTLYERLQNKQMGPIRLPPAFLNKERLHERIYVRSDKDAAHRPLADYEDLYYALGARMQEMHQLLNLRIHSGFNMKSDAVCEGGPTIGAFYRSMVQYWHVLNDPSSAKTLDDAIREAKVDAMRNEIARQLEQDFLTQEKARYHFAELEDPIVYGDILGLKFIRDWSPPMIGAVLNQKYCAMLRLEKEEADMTARQERREVNMR
ncbi:hypothetical protein BDW02DRAFT_499725, partial [Decorospora gaudefroyi]